MEVVTAGTVTAIIGVLIWYLKYTTRQQVIREANHDKIQKEERMFNRNLITNTLKEIHSTGLKNAKLNRESVGTLKTLCNKLNGGTEGIRAIASLKAINERKRNSKVKGERRK